MQLTVSHRRFKPLCLFFEWPLTEERASDFVADLIIFRWRLLLATLVPLSEKVRSDSSEPPEPLYSEMPDVEDLRLYARLTRLGALPVEVRPKSLLVGDRPDPLLEWTSLPASDLHFSGALRFELP